MPNSKYVKTPRNSLRQFMRTREQLVAVSKHVIHAKGQTSTVSKEPGKSFDRSRNAEKRGTPGERRDALIERMARRRRGR